MRKTKQTMKKKGKRQNQTQGEPIRVRHGASSEKSRIVAPETDVTLTYVETANLTSAGAGGIARRWTPNAAFDVDPVLGSTATPGFDEWAVFYDYYRVYAYSYEIEAVGKENFPLTVFVLNTNTDPSTSITNWVQYSAQAYCSSKMTALANGSPSKVTFRGDYSVAQILGSIVPETDDLYSAVVSTVPQDLVWLSLGVYVPGSSLLGAGLGIDFNIKIYMKIRFYGRKISLLSSPAVDRQLVRSAFKILHDQRIKSGWFQPGAKEQRRRRLLSPLLEAKVEELKEKKQKSVAA